MLKITDKRFRYTPSYETDLRKKFRRIEQERKARAKEAEQVVTVLPARKARG